MFAKSSALCDSVPQAVYGLFKSPCVSLAASGKLYAMNCCVFSSSTALVVSLVFLVSCTVTWHGIVASVLSCITFCSCIALIMSSCTAAPLYVCFAFAISGSILAPCFLSVNSLVVFAISISAHLYVFTIVYEAMFCAIIFGKSTVVFVRSE